MAPLNPLNPESGDVPFPEDHREVEAALRAGKISYRFIPYLEWRYHERGIRFTRSDSAWLAWLTRHRQEHVDQQIIWLRNILANRGMPSWILERHLCVLHRQLVRAIPQNKPKYDSLQNSAERLRKMTAECISPDRAEQVVEDFVTAIGRGPQSLLQGTAMLIVVAVADEKSGVEHAVSSLQDWLNDLSALRKIEGLRNRLSMADRRFFNSNSFAERWLKTVEETVKAARRN